jgi:cupin fold WbuC family metalloprotein
VKKINEGVFQLEEDFSVLEEDMIKTLIDESIRSNKRRARINFHPNGRSNCQEMIICLQNDAELPIHYHENKSESFHVIEGTLGIVLLDEGFDKNADFIILNGEVGPVYYRLNSSKAHLVVGLSDYVIFHEVTEGPYNGKPPKMPEWSIGKEDEVESLRVKLRNEFIERSNRSHLANELKND